VKVQEFLPIAFPDDQHDGTDAPSDLGGLSYVRPVIGADRPPNNVGHVCGHWTGGCRRGSE
jgi:hypothetical protein